MLVVVKEQFILFGYKNQHLVLFTVAVSMVLMPLKDN
jgi:hypothetical protein